MKKLRTGDEVIVISGKDTGKTGTLSKFISETKCIVSGVKIVKKHQKPNPQLNIQGGILEKESPIDVSNLAIYNKKSKKADKINIEIKKDKKIRVFKFSKKIEPDLSKTNLSPFIYFLIDSISVNKV